MNANNRPGRTAAFFAKAAEVIAWPGLAASWLTVALLIGVLVSVLGGVFRVTQFLDWEGEVFLFGGALTLNSVLELQWHVFGVLVMLGGVYALQQNRHVRVDVVYDKLPRRARLVIEILGDLFLPLPFCYFMTTKALPLVELAYNTGEMSNEDGLTHRWLIKSVIPLGFTLLGLLGVARIGYNSVILISGKPPPEGSGDVPTT